MIRHPRLRALLGVVLGACAGSSLCLSILPLVLFQARIGDEMTLTRLLSAYLPHVALVWAAGGWGVARVGFPLGGGVVLAAAGLGSGMFATAMALHVAPKILVVGGATGLLYGFLGGLILGRILARDPGPGEDPA